MWRLFSFLKTAFMRQDPGPSKLDGVVQILERGEADAQKDGRVRGMSFDEARKEVEDIWSRLSKSEQLRLLDFFSAPKGEAIRAARSIKFKSSRQGPGDDETKVTMAVAAGRKAA